MANSASLPLAPTATASSDAEIAKFEAILRQQDDTAMRHDLLNLEWEEFERFVGYMFQCAGYTAKHHGPHHDHHHIDLELYENPDATGSPVALVEVRHYKVASLRHQSVAAFVGNVAIAGCTHGYMVTTSTFTAPARQAAEQAKGQGFDICLTDWRHLTRYLAYLRGSRVTDGEGHKRTPRPTPPDYLHAADKLPRRDPKQTRILVVSNNRGGVAKTTSSLNLALALLERDKDKRLRILLVDLDGQANLTSALPPPKPKKGQVVPPHRTIVEFFAGRAQMAELVRLTCRDRLWLLPSDGELYTRDKGGGADPEAEMRFVEALHTLELPTPIPGAGRFDWIILDTPPAQSSYTRAALAASHGIVLPTIVEPFAAFSITRLLETAKTMRGLIGRDGRILGSFGVRWPRRPSKQLQSELANLREKALPRGVTLLDTLIPEDPRIASANKKMIEGGISGIFAFQSSSAARAYRELLNDLEKEL